MSKPLWKHDGTNVVVKVPNVGIVLAVGATPPADAALGYAPNCLFLDLDATGGSGFYINRGTLASANFDAFIDLAALTATLAEINSALTGITATAAELNYMDASLATNRLTQGTGVDGAEAGYGAGIERIGSLIVTKILINLDDLIGSATDLDIIGESAVANCTWGQITAAKSGTIIGGRVTCLEVPAGGADDIDFYSSDVATGTQDVIITDAALGTETALVTAGGAWTLGLVKALSGLPTANDYIYVVNGAASGGTFTAGKFLVELFGI